MAFHSSEEGAAVFVGRPNVDPHFHFFVDYVALPIIGKDISYGLKVLGSKAVPLHEVFGGLHTCYEYE